MAQSKVEKIASIEQEIKQLKERQKQLQQQHNLQERKARTKRLIERGAILESFILGADEMSNEQIKDIMAAALSGKAEKQVATFVPAGKETMPNGTPKAAAGVEG